MADGRNVYAAILAGGSGTRMGNPEKPKQFLMLGDKPILAHTVEKFCAVNLFDSIVILCPEPWRQQTRDLLRRYCPDCCEKIAVEAGGATRNDTVRNAISYFCENANVDERSILVTHDAVRPFVSHRIIEENVQAAIEFGACDTVVPATDTIVQSDDGALISAIPDRSKLYQGQTPQSFNLLELKQLMSSLSSDEEAILTDACKIYTLRGRKVALVRGDVSNMKITYPHDLRVASALMGSNRA